MVEQAEVHRELRLARGLVLPAERHGAEVRRDGLLTLPELHEDVRELAVEDARRFVDAAVLLARVESLPLPDPRRATLRAWLDRVGAGG
ncbi:MAG: hypothetical protein U0229_08315 [Anaeromyxobacter sp.]